MTDVDDVLAETDDALDRLWMAGQDVEDLLASGIEPGDIPSLNELSDEAFDQRCADNVAYRSGKKIRPQPEFIDGTGREEIPF
jgi:hypothetical protein